MPGDVYLSRGDVKLTRNFLDLHILHVSTIGWESWKRVPTRGISNDSLTFSALPRGEYASRRRLLFLAHWKYRVNVSDPVELKIRKSTDLEQLRLGVPIVQLNLVHSRLDFERISSQILDPKSRTSGDRYLTFGW